MRDAVIVEAVRSPVGRRDGKLSGWHPVDLLAEVLRAAVERTGIDPAAVDDHISGCVSQTGEQGINIARNAWLAAGLPEEVPSTTVDRQCGSSQQAAHFAAQGVIAGVYDLAIAIELSEVVGAMSRCYDITTEWAFDRYSFGRPLASYQELKHRFADMKTWLEASHAIADAATRVVQDERGDAGEVVSAAKAYIAQYGVELCQECVQLHGGIGVTFDHDMHIYLRRVAIGAALYGTLAEHRLRIADIVESTGG